MVKGINKLLSKTKSKKNKHVVIFKKFDENIAQLTTRRAKI